MSTRTLFSTVTRLALGAACMLAATGCGSEMLRTGRSPVFLIVDSVSASAGGGNTASGSFLLSDVQVLVDVTVNGVSTKVPTIFNDNADVGISAIAKNQTVPTTPLNSVTLTRYHVNYRRADGRNTPGSDVPFAFDGPLSTTIPAGGNSQHVTFILVRHEAKLEPPLSTLVGRGGQGFISAIAEITFYGHDQNGNEVSVSANIDVQFGDFGDSQ